MVCWFKTGVPCDAVTCQHKSTCAMHKSAVSEGFVAAGGGLAFQYMNFGSHTTRDIFKVIPLGMSNAVVTALMHMCNM
jgi:hypothetical protein